VEHEVKATENASTIPAATGAKVRIADTGFPGACGKKNRCPPVLILNIFPGYGIKIDWIGHHQKHAAKTINIVFSMS
jgi:hypothetical protein